MFPGEWDIIVTFWGWKSNQNLTGFLYKRRRGTGLTSKSVRYQESRDNNLNKLWQKLSSMSIKTGLDFKTMLVWEKKERITKVEISSI